MPRRKNNNVKSRRGRGRRGRGRGGPQVHTFSYSAAFSIDKKEGERTITYGDFGCDVTRPCRVVSLRVQYSATYNLGIVFTYTIESVVSKADATARSNTLMMTTLPKSFTLRNPTSSDFGYVDKSTALSIISLKSLATSTTDTTYSFYLCTVTIAYQAMQPFVRDLGLLYPDKPQSSSSFSELE